MICTKPYFTGKAAYGCGQCMPCRFNRRRLWAHRIQLEALCHAQSSFVTLTYGDGDHSELVPRHLVLFLKRLRKNYVHNAIRYFAVGEYGDRTERPHYHLALFGVGPCEAPGVIGDCPCSNCSVVRRTWGFGHVMVGSLSPHSASYLAGYVTKKMTRRDDVRLGGRCPEFARMSLRPGIGAAAMWDVASVMMQYKLAEIPMGLRHGSRVLPLGRYLRGKLAEYSSGQINKDFVDERLRLVRAYAFENSQSLSEVWKELATPAALQLEGKLKLKERQL